MNDVTAPFPVKPISVPQARKYTREFKAAAGKIFTEEDTIIIEIPPIKNTYLTKDARIYFKFNLSFEDHNFTETTLPSPTWWAAWKNNYGLDVLNVFRKPVPMLESCGPYAFFRDVEVYDYLGNTLLEKVNRHDLLASILNDFHLDSDLDRMRPVISETQAAQIMNMFKSDGTLIPFNTSFSLPAVDTRINGVNLLDPSLNDNLATDPKRYSDYYAYIAAPPTVPATLVTVPTWQFSISLLSFLGKGSNNFVPLHNGYRIVLKTNSANVAMQFGLPSGSLTVPTTFTTLVVNLKPQIKEYSFFDVLLRADLLEVTPEFDQQIDKSVHARMNAYSLLGRCDTPTILPGNFLSVNNIKISPRQLPDGVNTYSVLGFRSRTYIDKARLLYNDAVQQEYTNVHQMRLALGPEFDETITPMAFSADQPNLWTHGTSGFLYPYLPQEFKAMLAPQTTLSTGYSWVLKKNDNLFFSRYNDQAGKFLVLFDLSLNGYHENTITGIDTTKTTIKLDFTREADQAQPFETDVFTEHDAIIIIKPGEYSTVSF